jgi:ferritin heavy chain
MPGLQTVAAMVGVLGVIGVGGVSRARHNFSEKTEAALNAQINLEYEASHAYAAMSAYFDRDDVALVNIAKHFDDAAEEEFGHARDISKYQTLRGGRVALSDVKKPTTHEFAATEFKSDALVAFEAALELEKRVYQSLLELSQLASDVNDPQLGDYLDGYLKEQVESINKVSKYVAQLERIGVLGMGVYTFDKELEDH